MLTYRAEMSLACTYSLRNPALAIQCVLHALTAAHTLKRMDLVWDANELLGVLRGGK